MKPSSTAKSSPPASAPEPTSRGSLPMSVGLFDLYLHHRHTVRLRRIERNQRAQRKEQVGTKASPRAVLVGLAVIVWLGLLGAKPVVGVAVGVGALAAWAWWRWRRRR